ncbi:hypothetical protein Pla175_09650 [Pirellulimonas nuda]|uniref:Polymerase nucleotidyl transferase domain-containing protein n=1 Tax=Pirellulimonas nuda TaxID=2528009 RepID=A0A518D825_9BACT|nr:nucleotidyl transferase AbiEii/AbiGii toxin family protein [Pirellulimonas nuda]QDU87600.1 hypothetical protein Pla175_09650 [Pirellulimonas nuda]
MEPTGLLRIAVEVLDRIRVPYAVVGSLASGAWGEPRVTLDVDIVIQLTQIDVAVLCAAFPEEEFYVSRSAIDEAVRTQGQFNVLQLTTGMKIDFMVIGFEGWPAEQMRRRRPTRLLEEREVLAASPEDVILGKLIYFKEGRSPKHLRDMASILNERKDRLDSDYIVRWATTLGVLAEWEELHQRMATGDFTVV